MLYRQRAFVSATVRNSQFIQPQTLQTIQLLLLFVSLSSPIISIVTIKEALKLQNLGNFLKKARVMVGILIVYAAFTLVAETATGDPNTFRSTAFEDPINGKRLDAGKVIETRQEASRTKCALACSKNDDCLSFGFCGETSCELYNEDIFSTELGENILEEDANCKYFGMKKESKPVCQQDGVFADIQKNDNDERCQIAGKRVDEGWGPWVNTKIDDGVQWKITNHRDISVHVAHGGTQAWIFSFNQNQNI